MPTPTATTPDITPLVQAALKAKDAATIFPQIESTGGTPQQTLDLALAITNDLYWTHKNTKAIRQLSAAAIAWADEKENALREAAALNPADEVASRAKAFQYNLASFLWRGWAEPGITLTRQDETAGLAAAYANLALAHALHKSPLALSRAHWMLAGQLVSAGNYKAALEHYNFAIPLAHAAEAFTEESAAQTFATWTQTLIDPTNSSLQSTLNANLTHLQSLPNGPFHANQLTTAQQVFAPAPLPIP